MPTTVEILETIETQVIYKNPTDKPNATEEFSSQVVELSSRERDGQQIENWRFAEGAQVTLPDEKAEELIELEKAKEI